MGQDTSGHVTKRRVSYAKEIWEAKEGIRLKYQVEVCLNWTVQDIAGR